MAKYPGVIIDLSQATPEILRTVGSRANQVIVVSTPTLPSLRLARSLVHEIKDIRGKEDKGIELVINMLGMASGNEVPKKDIEKAMDLKISATVPFAPKIFMGLESESKKVISDKDGMLIVRTSVIPVLLKTLNADAPTEEEAQTSKGFLGSILSKIKKK
jgi:Flp pilus assembly CpaE family ATPase